MLSTLWKVKHCKGGGGGSTVGGPKAATRNAAESGANQHKQQPRNSEGCPAEGGPAEGPEGWAPKSGGTPFWLKGCFSNVALFVTQRELLFSSLLPLVRRGAMPRRGWTAAPDGWVQFIRGPRPPSHRWPMAQGNRQPSVQESRRSVRPPQAQVQVGQGFDHPQRRPESKPSVARPDPDSAREAAHMRVIKLEKALKVVGESGEGQAVTNATSRSEVPQVQVARSEKTTRINIELDE